MLNDVTLVKFYYPICVESKPDFNALGTRFFFSLTVFATTVFSNEGKEKKKKKKKRAKSNESKFKCEFPVGLSVIC